MCLGGAVLGNMRETVQGCRPVHDCPGLEAGSRAVSLCARLCRHSRSLRGMLQLPGTLPPTFAAHGSSAPANRSHEATTALCCLWCARCQESPGQPLPAPTAFALTAPLAAPMRHTAFPQSLPVAWLRARMSLEAATGTVGRRVVRQAPLRDSELHPPLNPACSKFATLTFRAHNRNHSVPNTRRRLCVGYCVVCVVCCVLYVMYSVWCYVVRVLCVVYGVRCCAMLCGGFRLQKQRQKTRLGTFDACAELCSLKTEDALAVASHFAGASDEASRLCPLPSTSSAHLSPCKI